jgi:hypothetical protein
MEVGSEYQDGAVRAQAVGYAKCGKRAGLRCGAHAGGYFV